MLDYQLYMIHNRVAYEQKVEQIGVQEKLARGEQRASVSYVVPQRFPMPLLAIHEPWKIMAMTADKFKSELIPCNCENLEFSAFISGETFELRRAQ